MPNMRTFTEDEYREFMADAGLPLEKQPSSKAAE